MFSTLRDPGAPIKKAVERCPAAFFKCYSLTRNVLDIKTDVEDIPVLDKVVFSLQPYQAFFPGFCEISLIERQLTFIFG